MSEHAEKLTPRKRKAISELVSGANIDTTSSAVGVTPRTLNRWLKEDTFKAELRRAELRVMDAVGLRLVNLAGAAVDALETVLNEPSVRGASVKRLTAKDILELLLKWRSEIILEERIVNLERQVFYGKK